IVSSVVIAEHRREAAQRLVGERGWDGLSVDRAFEMPAIFIGSVDQIVDEMQARRERHGLSYFVAGDRSLDLAAPIVPRLAGGQGPASRRQTKPEASRAGRTTPRRRAGTVSARYPTARHLRLKCDFTPAFTNIGCLIAVDSEADCGSLTRIAFKHGLRTQF